MVGARNLYTGEHLITEIKSGIPGYFIPERIVLVQFKLTTVFNYLAFYLEELDMHVLKLQTAYNDGLCNSCPRGESKDVGQTKINTHSVILISSYQTVLCWC